MHYMLLNVLNEFSTVFASKSHLKIAKIIEFVHFTMDSMLNQNFNALYVA
jgi:hypothetical protein